MIILFIHRNFPAQFKNIAIELAKDSNNLVLFLTTNNTVQIPGINKILYNPKNPPSVNHPYLKLYQESVLHGQAASEMALEIKKRGIIPDIIYGHSWGSSMFMKDVFPNVPYLCYFEWFSKSKDSAYDFGNNILDTEKTAHIKCNNTQILLDLCSCNGGISPMKWQKNQFPSEFQDKIEVIHDGVDTEVCKPNKEAEFLIKDKDLKLTSKNEVITYATRGMEELRGFPQFIEAVDKLLKKRPNAHFVIAGEDKVFYGPTAPEGTFKEYVLKKFDLDMNRVHFVGKLSYEEYLNLLQISSAHVYLTYPFVLSWSILEAMSCECCVIASNTQPVLEVIQDNQNGFLVDFFNIEQLTEKIEYAVINSDKMSEIRKNARKTILKNYDKNNLVHKHIEFINEFIKK